MAKFRGYRVLSGSYAEVWIDGDLIAEAKKSSLRSAMNVKIFRLVLTWIQNLKVRKVNGHWS